MQKDLKSYLLDFCGKVLQDGGRNKFKAGSVAAKVALKEHTKEQVAEIAKEIPNREFRRGIQKYLEHH